LRPQALEGRPYGGFHCFLAATVAAMTDSHENTSGRKLGRRENRRPYEVIYIGSGRRRRHVELFILAGQGGYIETAPSGYCGELVFMACCRHRELDVAND
jgi:hypothetical protein